MEKSYKMERLYETTVILDPDLSREDVDNEVGKLVSIISNHSGTADVSYVGRRGLEYPINKKSYGQYVLLTHGGDNSVVSDLERQILINEKMLRHLTVAKDKFSPSDEYESFEESQNRSNRTFGVDEEEDDLEVSGEIKDASEEEENLD